MADDTKGLRFIRDVLETRRRVEALRKHPPSSVGDAVAFTHYFAKVVAYDGLDENGISRYSVALLTDRRTETGIELHGAMVSNEDTEIEADTIVSLLMPNDGSFPVIMTGAGGSGLEVLEYTGFFNMLKGGIKSPFEGS